ncbi:MAG TPA: deoxyribonuclease IV [Candidatus Moranbacteria bacterium]|nr:deoxyribonuclease IV [Candidatus Moranbacteria bacterium]HSA07834.1 deoxyribonuclease IV [Candidatus Moranbacteria bacterium]
MHIGCHVSIAGGVQNAPERAHDLGCECFQMFTRSPQGGKAPELTPEIINDFKILNTKHQIQNTYIHTPYYINFASQNNRVRYGSVSVVRDELERATLLGAKYVMTHLGSAGDLSEKEASEKTIEMLKKTLDGYAGSAQLLIENSAGAGKIIGDDLSEIAEIINKVNHPALVGICLDTQHSFASGYAWRDFENTIKKIDAEIGLEKIKLIHANDSLTEFNSKKDRHAHIGQGQIGPEAFQNIVKFAKEKNIDMILETEHEKVKEDIELLKKLRD